MKVAIFCQGASFVIASANENFASHVIGLGLGLCCMVNCNPQLDFSVVIIEIVPPFPSENIPYNFHSIRHFPASSRYPINQQQTQHHGLIPHNIARLPASIAIHLRRPEIVSRNHESA